MINIITSKDGVEKAFKWRRDAQRWIKEYGRKDKEYQIVETAYFEKIEV